MKGSLWTSAGVAAALLLATARPAASQDEMPAVGSVPSAERPAAKSPGAGTTIVGERESPIGLYITPWRDARPETDVDRPARLLQEQLKPIDETVFLREVEYHRALSGALEAKGKVTP